MRKLFTAAYLLGSFSITQAQECSQLLSQGIYDIRSSASDLNTASSFSQWFCDKKFSSSDQANEFGASLGFPFKGVPVKLGFNSSSQSWSEWYSSFCGSVKSDQLLQTKVSDHVQTSKYPPAKPGALGCEPLKAANRGRSRDPDLLVPPYSGE